MYMKSDQGFSLPEFLLIVALVLIVGFIGFFVYRKGETTQAQKLENSFSYSRGSMPNADAQSIADFFQFRFKAEF
jgi:Tfp pilus assembly protein FimT